MHTSFQEVFPSAYEVKINCYLFERPFKVKKPNDVFLLGIPFFFAEIFTFLYYAKEDLKVMTS